MVSIAIIIPTYNRKECLKKLLEIIGEQITVDLQLLQIVVVDSSMDGTYEMLEKDFPSIKIVQGNGNWWYTKSINEGIRFSLMFHPDYLLTLNDDVEFENTYIQTLYNDYLRMPGEGMIGSIAYLINNKNKVTFSGIKEYILWKMKEIPYVNKYAHYSPEPDIHILPSKVLSGRGILMSSKLFNNIGPLDEKLPQYGSDTDFSYRALKQGYSVYISLNAKIYENERYTSKGALIKRPSFGEYVQSVFSPYSVNSLSKAIYFQKKHNPWFVHILYVPYVYISVFFVYFFKRKK